MKRSFARGRQKIFSRSGHIEYYCIPCLKPCSMVQCQHLQCRRVGYILVTAPNMANVLHRRNFSLILKHCLILTLIFREDRSERINAHSLQGYQESLTWKFCQSLKQTSADSTVRVLSLSRFFPDLPESRVRCLSVRILSVSVLSAVRII